MGQEERGGGWRGRRQVQRLVPCSEAECGGNPSLERFVQSPDPQAWYVTLIKLLNLNALVCKVKGKSIPGVEEGARSVKCLANKYEDLGSMPRSHSAKSGVGQVRGLCE